MAALLLALSAPPRSLLADVVSPGVPARIVRETPKSRFELTAEPAVRWQARLLEPLLGAPAADGGTGLVVAHASGLVVELDASGRTRTTVRAGSSLAFGPILLASRRRVVVTGDAEAVVTLPSGRIESRQRLSFRELDASMVAFTTADGGALIGSGARFARLGSTGTITARGSVRETLRSVLEWRGLGILVERGGRVLGLGHAGDPYELAHLGRAVRACEVRGDTLLALVGERELVELALGTKTVRTLWAEPPLVPRDLFVLPNGDLRVVASSNLLVALDAAGRETFRVPQPGPSSDTTVVLFGDSRGAALVATGGLDLRLVGETGEVTEIAGTACPDPLRPAPLATGLVVASCRSGLLFGISGKAR
ncbi:MAG TPA: hypothetical protein VFZ53_11730 [Polyangiaceae bacterium]